MTHSQNQEPLETLTTLCARVGILPSQHAQLLDLWDTLLRDAKRFDAIRTKLMPANPRTPSDYQNWLFQILLLETLADHQPTQTHSPNKEPKP